MTDHYPIMLNLHTTNKHNTTKTKMVIKTITKINEQDFTNLLRLETWNNVLQKNDVIGATDELYKVMTDILEKSSTTKNHISREQIKRKPWITNGIIMSIKNRDKMKKKLLLNFNEFDKRVYKSYRNNLKKIIEKRKHEYYQNEIENAGNNLKKVYNLISEATNNNKKSDNKNNSIPPITDNDATPFSDITSMANHCNNYYVNIGIEMLNKIKKTKY